MRTSFSAAHACNEGGGQSGNTKGRDWFIQQEETPAYTHSYLLTQLVSPNYVDVTGNGVTEDDMGDVVKFNYSKFNEGFKWRTPTGDHSTTPTTSYGSYSGAVPNEKITWGKLDINTPKFIVESDATIVAPLMIQALLEALAFPEEAERLMAQVF